jgi:hypothetical protein
MLLVNITPTPPVPTVTEYAVPGTTGNAEL